MKERMSREHVYRIFPELPKALLSLAGGVKSRLDPALIHLVEIRASQINRCGFCLDMHNTAARQHGEDQQRLDILAAWREVPWFNSRERAALAWCEALTRLADAPVDDGLYALMKESFNDEEILALTGAIVAINSWNRVVAAMHFIPVKAAPADMAIPGRPDETMESS